nr:MAG TPA: hypothetical protein [Caudoviricetes sp.]
MAWFTYLLNLISPFRFFDLILTSFNPLILHRSYQGAWLKQRL